MIEQEKKYELLSALEAVCAYAEKQGKQAYDNWQMKQATGGSIREIQYLNEEYLNFTHRVSWLKREIALLRGSRSG